ncbi:MAG: hypothetical protein IKW96_08810 [Ruminococcus sp.]|uniref:hypothetical protein n=1 Tax=Ruminococcus sp. TaxID=41978 RepID=UPI0025D22999|nr:hypothetical protein [Ruminococcus sp.]MBR5683356.1 hypothetical protein [Ruminococcus sp.]
MTFLRCVSAVMAAAVTISCCSCAAMNDSPPRISRYRDREREYSIGQSVADENYEEADESDEEMLDSVQLVVKHFTEQLEKPQNEDRIQENTEHLLDMLDGIYESRTFASVDFYSDYQNDEAMAAYQSSEHIYSVAEDLISYAFYCGMQSQYSELFTNIIPPEMAELYSDGTYDLETARAEAEAAYYDSSEDRNRYYEVISDDTLSDDAKDLECAEILIDMLSDETPESFYESYYRDYSGEDILALKDTVLSEVIPAYYAIEEAWHKTAPSGQYENDMLSEAPFDVIRTYAKELSPDISRSADRLIDEELFSISNNPDAFNIAFTDDLPTQNSAYIFIGEKSRDNVLMTAVHEFGHFHASFYDDTHAYLMKNNYDIAEVQSHGMEILFTSFFDDIYGSDGDRNRLKTLADMCYYIFSAFYIGSFEYELVSRIDDITPEEVVRLYENSFSDYNIGYRLSDISHLYECPGYYISYATSGLASLQLFFDMRNDMDKALEKYKKIAKISCYSGEYTFRQALAECGFEDVLSKGYITGISRKMREYAAEITAQT